MAAIGEDEVAPFYELGVVRGEVALAGEKGGKVIFWREGE